MKNKKMNFGLIMVVYLLGLFMGAIDTGIVTPARTVIQNDLGVNENTGIWMITIYTLAYAASIPIMGKLADKYGRKYIYLSSILLFGIGSLFCGLSQSFGSFSVLLIARVVQAIGGGGILPIATAEFGTTFPKEKRGLALGMVGGVYGLANIFGASAGSAIIDIFGQNNWQFIFYINVPITIFILIAGIISLPNTKEVNVKKIDFLGIATLTLMVLSILYGLKNIDYFNFANTFMSTSVYPYLIIFIVLLPIFIVVEKKAEDPVINIAYFKNVKIIITLFIAFITGIIIMGMIFVPQFAENSLKITSGSGGYFVIILGLFAGVGAPFSGKLIDKYGAKVVLGIGFIASISGSLFLIFYTAAHPSLFAVVICLILLGLGIGFTMGTPINYMMLDNTRVEEANSALATVSLIRSIGTAIAPAIMIGFIAHAGMAVQGNVMMILPNEVSVPPLPYAKELTDEFNQLKADPSMAEKLKGIDIPDLTAMETIKFDMASNTGNFELPEEMINHLQASDVTTITDTSKEMADYMFMQMTPSIITNITGGIDSGITGINDSISEMTKAMDKMQAMPSMKETVEQMNNAKLMMSGTVEKMSTLKEALPGAFDTAKTNYLAEIENKRNVIENEFQGTLNNGFKQVYSTVAIASLLAMIVLMFYREDRKYKVNMAK
jgi:EmrB/QacA subfamily drug resistance transporter